MMMAMHRYDDDYHPAGTTLAKTTYRAAVEPSRLASGRPAVADAPGVWSAPRARGAWQGRQTSSRAAPPRALEWRSIWLHHHQPIGSGSPPSNRRGGPAGDWWLACRWHGLARAGIRRWLDGSWPAHPSSPAPWPGRKGTREKEKKKNTKKQRPEVWAAEREWAQWRPGCMPLPAMLLAESQRQRPDDSRWAKRGMANDTGLHDRPLHGGRERRAGWQGTNVAEDAPPQGHAGELEMSAFGSVLPTACAAGRVGFQVPVRRRCRLERRHWASKVEAFQPWTHCRRHPRRRLLTRPVRACRGPSTKQPTNSPAASPVQAIQAPPSIAPAGAGSRCQWTRRAHRTTVGRLGSLYSGLPPSDRANRSRRRGALFEHRAHPATRASWAIRSI